MESPLSARHTSFSGWTLQPEAWDQKFVGSSRFSSYATKFPSYRYNDSEPLRTGDSTYINWPRDGVSSPTDTAWQHSTLSAFPFSTHGPQRNVENPHHHDHSHGSAKGGADHGMTTKHQVEHDASPSTLTSSSIVGAQAARAPKRHVKSACFNCKRAHLSCDVQRPCTRCIQTGKTATCVDVPQRRKGRPRLRQDSIRKTGRNANTKLISVKPLAAVHEHRQLNPLQNFAYHTGFGMPAELCTVCSYIPMVFLDIDLRIVQTNQYFRGLFDFLGDVHGRTLEHLVESSDWNLLRNVRLALRQEVEREISTSATPIQILEQGDVGKLPHIESHDIPRITKPSATRKEMIHLRFADGNARGLSVDFSLSKTEVLFVTMTLPPMRPASMVLPSSQHALARTDPPSFAYQGFDPHRSQYGRQLDRMPLPPLPSPDIAGHYSTSPSSSYSFSSASTLAPGTRTASLASQRSYEPLLMVSSMSNPQPSITNVQVDMYSKQFVPKPAVSTPAINPGLNLASSSSTHLAPLQDQAPSRINTSRRLPPIPGLGSPDSQASDNAGSAASRSQQVYWQGQGQDSGTKPENKTTAHGQDWQNESPSKRTRVDVKELTS